jgi:hypothetical protein
MRPNFITRPALLLCLTTTSVIGLSACGPSPSSSSPPLPPPPSSNPPPVTAATDCSQSDVELLTSAALPSGTYSAKTDRTRTSLLIQNTGSSTLIVRAWQNTALQPTADINPADPVDAVALRGLAASNVLATDPNIPAGTPLDAIYIVPPQYGVCGTVSSIFDSPGVFIEPNRNASAAWYVAHSVAQTVYDKLHSYAFKPDKNAQAMMTCARETVSLASQRPDLSDPDLYANVMQLGSNCYQSYEAVFRDAENSDEAAAKSAHSVQETALGLLDRAPKLLEDLRAVLDFVHR